jgi:hypothetical protein
MQELFPKTTERRMNNDETRFKVGESAKLTRPRTWLLFVLFGIIGVSILGMI